MDLLLEHYQILLQENACRLCGDLVAERSDSSLQNYGLTLDAQAWRKVAAAGWLSLLLSEDAGGSCLETVELLLILREAGRHRLVLPLRSAAIAAAALENVSVASPLAKIRSELASGQSILAPALNGAATPFDLKGQLPRLVRTGSCLTIDGEHRFVADGPFATHFLMLVQSDDGAEALVGIDAAALGMTQTAQVNADGSAWSDLRLKGLEIGDDAVIAIGDEADRLLGLLRARLLLGASVELLGVGEASLNLALEHAKLREQFGRKIGSFQALQHRLVDSHIGLELLHSFVFRVAVDIERQTSSLAAVSAVKAKAGVAALHAVRTALQVHGAMGYTAEHEIGRLFKRALTLDALYGNSAAHFGEFERIAMRL